MIFQFADIKLDTDSFTLLKEGEPQSVEPQTFDLIVYLLRRREQLVSRQQLFDDLWQGRIVSDATLSNHIRSARAVLGDDGEKQEVIKTVRGRGYKFVAEIAVVDSTKEGVVGEGNRTATEGKPQTPNRPQAQVASQCLSSTPADPGSMPQPKTQTTKLAQGKQNFGLVMEFVIAAIFIAMVANFIWQWLGPEKSRVQPSIAVMPFANGGEETGDHYLSDGFHDDLLTQISQISAIKTISRTSVMSYRGKNMSIQQIAQELNVSHILEGSFQRAGNQIRINVRLVNTSKDDHEWAHTYTRQWNAENIFLIQSEIVQLVTRQMQLRLAPDENSQLDAPPTQNMAALEAWFMGKYSEGLGTTEGHKKAVAYYQQAIHSDPSFAKAYARIGVNLLWNIWRENSPPEQQMSIAEPYIEKALSLAPGSSFAYAALGDLERRKRNFDVAEQAYQKAIRLNPNNVEAYTAYANMLAWRLRKESQALQLYRQILVLDPNNLSAAQQLGELLLLTGQLQEAQALLESLAQKHPNISIVHHSLGMLYSWGLMKYDQAIISFSQALSIDPSLRQSRWMIAESYKELGDKSAVIYWLENYFQTETNKEIATYDWLGVLAEAKGDMDLAYQYYEKVPIQNPSPASMTLYALAKRDQRLGNLNAAVQRYAQALPQLEDAAVSIDSYLFSYASSYAEFLIAAGKTELATQLLARAKEFIAIGGSEVDWYAVNLTLYYVVSGDKQKAIDVLQNYADKGHSFNFNKNELAYEKNLTIYEALKDEAQFIALYQLFEARKQAQRERLSSSLLVQQINGLY